MTFADLAASATKDKEFAKEKKENVAEEEEGGEDDGAVDVEATPDVQFTPIVKLEAVETKTLEEDETELLKMRAKMFRFEKETNEWKERGTGDVKLLQKPSSSKVRLVMRRDQTLKICANHMVTPEISLRSNVGSDRSWVYSVLADVSEGEPRAELFAIRFANPENANVFKAKFEDCQKLQDVHDEVKDESKKPEAKTPEEESLHNNGTEENSKNSTKEDDKVNNIQKSLEEISISEPKKSED
jgi:Ran-binding protein 1